jgi:hypothetical protein
LEDPFHAGEGKYKMNLKYLVVPESLEVLKEYCGHAKGYRSQLKKGQIWDNENIKQNDNNKRL